MNAERNADSRAKAQKVLQKSEQQGRNEFVVDYDEMNPFALDCAALKPIYKVSARTPLPLPSRFPAPFALSLCRPSLLPHEHLLTFTLLPFPLSLSHLLRRLHRVYPHTQGSPSVKCSYCASAYAPAAKGSVCSTCRLCTVGLETVGLVTQAAPSRK